MKNQYYREKERKRERERDRDSKRQREWGLPKKGGLDSLPI